MKIRTLQNAESPGEDAGNFTIKRGKKRLGALPDAADAKTSSLVASAAELLFPEFPLDTRSKVVAAAVCFGRCGSCFRSSLRFLVLSVLLQLLPVTVARVAC